MADLDYLLFPTLQAPVLTDAMAPEVVTEDRWHQPWSEPVRFRINRQLAVALAATSGMATLDMYALTLPESVSIDRWLYPWSEPKRFPRGLAPQAQQFFAIAARDAQYPGNADVSDGRAPLHLRARGGRLASIWMGGNAIAHQDLPSASPDVQENSASLDFSDADNSQYIGQVV